MFIFVISKYFTWLTNVYFRFHSCLALQVPIGRSADFSNYRSIIPSVLGFFCCAETCLALVSVLSAGARSKGIIWQKELVARCVLAISSSYIVMLFFSAFVLPYCIRAPHVDHIHRTFKFVISNSGKKCHWQRRVCGIVQAPIPESSAPVRPKKVLK